MPASKPAEPVLTFATQAEWASWLAANHASAGAIWLVHAKKGASFSSVSYAEALDVALAWGWIDSQKGSLNAESWRQRFGRRGPRSPWSQVNREKVEALLAAGKMHPPGLAEVERAKQDGRWERAYPPASRATVPADLQAALDADPAAREHFAALDAANRYAILFRVETASTPKTRAARISQFVAMLREGGTLHPAKPRK